MNSLDISRQCPNGIFCERQKCKKKHYRCFTGLCVQEILDCGSCINYQCKLVHYSKNEYRSELNIKPINGIYRFNICRNKKCRQQNGCLFLHPEWAKDYCIDFVMDECDDTNHTNHVYWNDMREEYIKNIRNNQKQRIILSRIQNIYKFMWLKVKEFIQIIQKDYAKIKQNIVQRIIFFGRV